MIRPVQAIAALAVLACAAGAQAAPAAPALHLSYRVADLASVAGRETIKARFAAAADSWCRATPAAGPTVADCKARVGAELDKRLESAVRTYAEAHRTLELASR